MPFSPAEEVALNAGHLIESLRDFGYTLQSALADLIDNSLRAEVTDIEVIVHAGKSDSYIAVVDNGNAMHRATLIEVMQMGGSGPLGTRLDGDLGRFGLRMKAQSLSQRRFLIRYRYKFGADQ